jgi:hypothetical protein
MPSGEGAPSCGNGDVGDTRELKFRIEGEPPRLSCCCRSMSRGENPCGEGCPEKWNGSSFGEIEMDARGLNLPCRPAKDSGEATDGTVGLCVAEVPWKTPGKGKPCWPPLAVEPVGIGGEKGNGGYCIDALLFSVDRAGEIDGASAGSSSPKETPSALSLASCNSLT